ncbi:hypothetical protein JCM10212_003450 [Sporobolomyces blumeae]
MPPDLPSPSRSSTPTSVKQVGQKEKKTRSRTGCLSCRSRHKRCDETRLPEHNGACKRCFVGSWECRWPVPLAERPLKSVRGDKAVKGERPSRGTTAATEGAESGGDDGDSSLQGAEAIPGYVGPHVFDPTTSTSTSAYPNGQAHPAAYPVPSHPAQNPLATYSLPYPTLTSHYSQPIPTAQSHPHPSSILPPPPPPPIPLPVVPGSSTTHQQNADLNDFFASLDAELELGYWGQLGPEPAHDSGASAEFTTMPMPGDPDAEMGVPSSAAGTRGPEPPHAQQHYQRVSPPPPAPMQEEPVEEAVPPRPHATHSLPPPAARAPLQDAAPPRPVPLERPAPPHPERPPSSRRRTRSPTPPDRPSRPPPLPHAHSRSYSHSDVPVQAPADAQPPSRPQPPQLEPRPSVDDDAAEPGPSIVDPIYNTFNEGFFRSLPKPVRDIVVKRLYGIANSSDLSRDAAMAMVMLYRLRMQSSSSSTAGPGGGGGAGQAEKEATELAQKRLLAQSDVYFQRAMEHLQKPIPFEAKMVACLDMQAYQFDQFGAAAANAIVLLGEYFINEALGSQPALDLSSIRNPLDVLLGAFAWTDCIRCICIPKRRTVFAFSNLPGESTSTASASASSSGSLDPSSSEPHTHSIETHLGLPVGLLLCIAATANLSAEMEALPDEVVKFKGDAIEKAIREWRAPAMPLASDPATSGVSGSGGPGQGMDSAAWIEKLATAEMWRYACILFLYQAVFRHGSLSIVVRSALSQILQLGARMLHNHPIQTSSLAAASFPPTGSVDSTPAASNPLLASTASSQPRSTGAAPPAPAPPPASDPSTDDYVSACSTRAVPWFLAATVATLPGDRDLCRKGLSVCGKQKGYRDNLDAVERIWDVVDQNGWCVDWRALLQSEKRFVGFL